MENMPTKKICIIEDEQDLLEMYSRAFRQEGFSVFTAENGEKGMSLIREIRPDAVVLDLQMPVKNGFEVLEEMRADEALVTIPVVILSNIDSERAFSEAERSQSCYYLLKVMTTPQKAVDVVIEALHEKEN